MAGKLTFDLMPKTRSIQLAVQNAGFNPMLRVKVSGSKTVAHLVQFLRKRWVSSCTNDLARKHAIDELGTALAFPQSVRFYPFNSTNHNGWGVDETVITLAQIHSQLNKPSTTGTVRLKYFWSRAKPPEVQVGDATGWSQDSLGSMGSLPSAASFFRTLASDSTSAPPASKASRPPLSSKSTNGAMQPPKKTWTSSQSFKAICQEGENSS